MLSKADADTLVAEDKLITANIRWQPARPGRASRNLTFEVTVLAPAKNVMLRLHGWRGITKRSFALLYGNDPIRKITVHGRHHNPDCDWIHGPHKHKWDDIDEDRVAYVPVDVRFGDPNTELEDFLRECNITLLGTYQRSLL